MFKKGMVLGRFQGFHLGHQAVIDKALETCESVLIFIGSSDKSGSVYNPFPYELRAAIVNDIYNGRVTVAPLPERGLGDIGAWGEYMLESASKVFGMPDCFIFGNEEKCHKWFPNNELTFIPIDRSLIKIHGTELRELIYNDDYKSFSQFTDERIHKYYGIMRQILLTIPCD